MNLCARLVKKGSGMSRLFKSIPQYSSSPVLIKAVLCSALFSVSSLNAATSNPSSWTRGADNSVYVEWDVFNSSDDSSADVGSNNIASANVTETTGSSFLTSAGNIYNGTVPGTFTVTVTPDSNGPVIGNNAKVYLQLVTQGTEPDTSSVRLDGVAATTVQLVSSEALGGYGGTRNTYLFTWTTIAPTEWQFSFTATGIHMSLDKVAVDIASIASGAAGDTDGDGIADSADNCINKKNANQLDYDNDGKGNVCDDSPYLTKTIRSSGGQDGWILESKETSNKGGKTDAKNTALIVGDSAADQEYRTVLHFDTSSLPDTAVITKVTLTVKKQSLAGSVSSLGSLLADMRVNYFGAASSLANSDFEAPAGKNQVAILKAGTSGYSGLLNTTGKTYINKAGATQMRLRFAKDDNDDKGNDYLKFYSGNAPFGSRPSLVIQYYIP